MRTHSRQLGLFLAARLAAYLLFATLVWFVGASVPPTWARRSWLFGGVQLLLAITLLVYAAGWPRLRLAASRHRARLVQIGTAPGPRPVGALALGFLTGITICPPFLVAGVRAAQMATLWNSILFFLFFFGGTAIWFAPLLSLGILRRTPAIVTVGRIAAALLACVYAFSGLLILMEKTVYG